MVVEEEWFDDEDLTDGTTFPSDLIKHAKSRFNQKIKFPREKKATHTGNYNKQWLEHTDFPDIA